MKVVEKILYFAFVIGWVVAPWILQNIVQARNIAFPTDLGTRMVFIWYTIGITLYVWAIRKNIKSPNESKTIS